MKPVPSDNRERSSRFGFSLVELLVATTILLVVVVMTSMVFQQTNGAFQSGTRRVKLQASMRTVSGVIMHDLAFIVAPTLVPDFPRKPNNRFDADEICFWASGGTSGPLEGPSGGEGVTRPFRYISYRFSGGVIWRKEECLVQRPAGNDRWVCSLVSEGEVRLNGVDDAFHDVVFTPVGGTPAIPLRVDIHMEKEATGNATYVCIRSAGPDGQLDTRDDIWAGESPFAD